VYLRGYALLVEALLNGRPFEEFFNYARILGESSPRFLRRIYDNLNSAPKAVRSVMTDFLGETRDELWDSEENLINFYRQSQNYESLIRGEVGGNLIYKYKSKSIAFTTSQWIDYLSSQLLQLAEEQIGDGPALVSTTSEIKSIERFCRHKVHGLLDVSADLSDIEDSYEFHVAAWLQAEKGMPLSRFKCKTPAKYRFHFTEEQLLMREDHFSRYGTDVNALSKIVTRISNLESLFRKVATPDGEIIEYMDSSTDQFTRYALSH